MLIKLFVTEVLNDKDLCITQLHNEELNELYSSPNIIR